jgi:hypothetical protein
MKRIAVQPQHSRRFGNGLVNAGRMLEILNHLRGISLHPAWPQTTAITSPDAYISQSARLAETFDILDEIDKRSAETNAKGGSY